MSSAVVDFLTHNQLAVGFAAVVILTGAFLFYWIWFRPAVQELEHDLMSLYEALGEDSLEWHRACERARVVVANRDGLRHAWKETEDRVMPLRHGDRILFVMFGSPRDLWSAPRLLSRSINLALSEAIPNLLVGFGLLLTFFFLTLSLNQATDALLQVDGQEQTDVIAATRGLLSAAGAKFLTSLAGLLASILWTIGARRHMARLVSAVDRLLDRLQALVRPSGGEMFLFAQLQAALQQVTATNNLSVKAQRQLEWSEDLLAEARKQTGALKRFETGLADSLAGTMASAFVPQMQVLTDRLISAIDGLNQKPETEHRKTAAKPVEGLDNDRAGFEETIEEPDGKRDATLKQM